VAYIRKPNWLKIEKGRSQCGRVNRILQENNLNSVCSEAGCPNQGECFKNGTATFLLLGKNCTRNCTFCQVTQAVPEPVNEMEPEHVARAVRELSLEHVVITSVTRDDLVDGGAGHFAKTIKAVRNSLPQVIIEVLIPDFNGDDNSLQIVLSEKPDILNHNVETVSELYSVVRPMADITRSLYLLKRAKELSEGVITKSGFMVGLGETTEQVKELLLKLKQVKCDMITIGQYLQPSSHHYPVYEYVHPDIFKEYKEQAHKIGIPCVSSGPLVRSSYHAKEAFKGISMCK
jgi:lipoic acid synthetase